MADHYHAEMIYTRHEGSESATFTDLWEGMGWISYRSALCEDDPDCTVEQIVDPGVVRLLHLVDEQGTYAILRLEASTAEGRV